MKNLSKIVSVALATTIISSVCAGVTSNALTSTKTSLHSTNEVAAIEGLTDIGNGIKLHSREMGTGESTVVFDSGYGDGLSTMSTGTGVPVDNFLGLQKEISKYTRTIAYERTGLGSSSDVGNMEDLSTADIQTLMSGKDIGYNENDFTGNTKTPRDKAINLHKLLEAKNIPGPYVLVVHSIGGHTAIEFAKMYKEELAGVVFLDGTARTGQGTAYNFFNKYDQGMAEDFIKGYGTADGTLSEVLIGENQVRNDEDALRNIPILYLESDQGNVVGGEMGEDWKKLRGPQVKDILSLSNHSEYKLIEGAGHYVHLDKPEEVNKLVVDFVSKLESVK